MFLTHIYILVFFSKPPNMDCKYPNCGKTKTRFSDFCREHSRAKSVAAAGKEKKEETVDNDFFRSCMFPNFHSRYFHLFDYGSPLVDAIIQHQDKVHREVKSFIKIGENSVYRNLDNEIVAFVHNELGNDFPTEGEMNQDIMAISVALPVLSKSNF